MIISISLFFKYEEMTLHLLLNSIQDVNTKKTSTLHHSAELQKTKKQNKTALQKYAHEGNDLIMCNMTTRIILT